MKPENTAAQVRSFVAESLGVDAAKVIESARFVEDLGADSLDLVEMIMAVEEKFEVTISDSNSEQIQTVGALINYIINYHTTNGVPNAPIEVI